MHYTDDQHDTNAHGIIIMGLPEGATRGEARAPIIGTDAAYALTTMPSGTIVTVKGNRVFPWEGDGEPTGVLAWPKSKDGSVLEGPARIRFFRRQAKGVMDNVRIPGGVSREAVHAALGPNGLNLLAA